MFLQRDTNDVIGQHTGRRRLEPGELGAWENVLRDRLALTDRLKATWLCQVAPDKEAVYPEKLPGT